jgi:glycosyltransferase involved in cell wall biosynthesis
MSEQIKILSVPPDAYGVGKYRCIDPHVYLNNNFTEDFFVDIVFDNVDATDFSKYHIVQFNKHLLKGVTIDYELQRIEEIRSKGTKVVMDMDDHWDVPKYIPSHNYLKSTKHYENQIKLAKAVDYVTTSTNFLASELKKKGVKNIIVFNNAIDPSENQFNHETKESELTRFGWLGGASHIEDINLLEGNFGKLNGSHKGKFQLVLCGFDDRGFVNEINSKGQIERRPMRPWETVWFKYESVFTDKYKLINDEYREELLKFKKDSEYDDSNQPYRRVWTRQINDYARGYSEFDVALAPLVENNFNRSKSELKVIEAGFYKKAMIAQNFGPYQNDLISKLNKGTLVEEGNSLLVDSSKNHKQWYQHMKRLIDNPEMITDLGEALYETVKDKYHLKTVTEKRKEFYKQLIK